ncbi:plasmid pRiA4b ORF-3 family protein [Amycolatopsis sp. K13G38]|uniref:Plasmid pRiA4b ORF-3 family protein n=1 Tax=Amycolatopsis acididurans TaxID=2724524 RepID=A0ABX1J8Y7_9PSEU|nr:plasmid pRiA4b ORF-3 family protein [Amycolatopsis acididurans]
MPGAAAALGVKVPAKVRTAADVAPIHWPWVAAEAAGLIEVGTAKAVACEVDGDPAELWLTGLDAVLRAESHDIGRRGAFTLCRAVLTARIEDRSVEHVLGGYEDGDTAELCFRQSEGLPVDDAIALLQSFGALDSSGEPTALGEWARERFEERAPESVTPALPVAELLARVAPLPEDEAWRLALRWFGERPPVFGASQLLHAAEFASPVERVAAVVVVAGFGDEVLAAWRNALRYKNLRAHAAAALADWGEGGGVDEAQRRWLVVEYALAARAKGGVEDAFHYVRDSGGLEVLAEAGHPGAADLHRVLTTANIRIRVRQLKISREAAVWRRVLVPDSLTLARLHEIVALLHGHSGDELHEFDVDGLRYSDPFYGLADRRDEHEVRLSTVFRGAGGGLTYRYDLAAPWEYRIACEKVLAPSAELTYPRCVAGEGDRFDQDAVNRRLAALRIPQP